MFLYHVELVSCSRLDDCTPVKASIWISVMLSFEQFSLAIILVVILVFATMQASTGRSPIMVGL